MERILNAPRFDLIIVDEAHHVSRIRYGKKQQTTLNYRLMEALQGHTPGLAVSLGHAASRRQLPVLVARQSFG